eukprot:1155541-Pelagomonas_calceolata.AAC.3
MHLHMWWSILIQAFLVQANFSYNNHALCCEAPLTSSVPWLAMHSAFLPVALKLMDSRYAAAAYDAGTICTKGKLALCKYEHSVCETQLALERSFSAT